MKFINWYQMSCLVNTTRHEGIGFVRFQRNALLTIRMTHVIAKQDRFHGAQCWPLRLIVSGHQTRPVAVVPDPLPTPMGASSSLRSAGCCQPDSLPVKACRLFLSLLGNLSSNRGGYDNDCSAQTHKMIPEPVSTQVTHYRLDAVCIYG